MTAGSRLLDSLQLYHPHQFQDGDGFFSLEVDQERRSGVFHQSQGCLLPDCILLKTLEEQIYQLRALCFNLSTAPQVFTRASSLVSQWAHRRGFWFLYYLNDWLVIVESIPYLLELCKFLLRQQVERSDLEPPARLNISEC